MRKCRHTRGGVDLFIRKRADGEDWDPVTPTCDQGEPIAWRCCQCGEYASLGPARDTPETAVEVRAAEIAASGLREDCGCCAADLSTAEFYGWHCIHDKDGPIEHAEHAGYLARCIAEHPTGADQ